MEDRIVKGLEPFVVARRNAGLVAALALAAAPWAGALAHHSFAMYDQRQTHVLTGVVTRVDPNPNHLQIFVAPLDHERSKVVRDDDGEPVIWAIEFAGSSVAARDGITVNGFPPGTIVSVGLHPLRNGFPGGGRGDSGFYKCPPQTPPAAGAHCDSVEGATSHGGGELPEPTGELPTP